MQSNKIALSNKCRGRPISVKQHPAVALDTDRFSSFFHIVYLIFAQHDYNRQALKTQKHKQVNQLQISLIYICKKKYL